MSQFLECGLGRGFGETGGAEAGATPMGADAAGGRGMEMCGAQSARLARGDAGARRDDGARGVRRGAEEMGAGAAGWTGAWTAGSVPLRQAVNSSSRAWVRRRSCSQTRIIAGQSRNGVRPRVILSSERRCAHMFMGVYIMTPHHECKRKKHFCYNFFNRGLGVGGEAALGNACMLAGHFSKGHKVFNRRPAREPPEQHL